MKLPNPSNLMDHILTILREPRLWLFPVVWIAAFILLGFGLYELLMSLPKTAEAQHFIVVLAVTSTVSFWNIVLLFILRALIECGLWRLDE